MNTLNNNENKNILDLPNEMLSAIFNKLNMTDVFYSLADINQQLDQLIFDPLYIRDLNLTTKSLFDTISPIDNQVLDRICERILPRINDKVNKLTIEPLSMERILHTIEYPQLHSLSLVNFQQETLLQHLTSDTILHHLIADQIRNLSIEIKDAITPELSHRNESDIFALVLSKCKYLNGLAYKHWFTDKNLAISIFNLPLTSCVSSILTKLNISVNIFDDCLYILDGRFECLSTLIIKIIKVFAASSNFDNTKKLPQLKCFSLELYSHTFFYDNEILPLLHRMSDLEELTLFLTVIRLESTYIDGNHLYDEILIHMPRLEKFTFSISTIVYNINTKIDLPSNDDIQRSFIKIGNQQVGSYTINSPFNIIGECRIFSIPYQFDNFLHLTSSFPGGTLNKVQYLTMTDIHPFEHELFKIISRDFPFLRYLSVLCRAAQQNKQHSSTSITFHHLVYLRLNLAHVDYSEQFLSERTTHLPRLSSLEIEYETLAIVTNNFTNDATRHNCAQLKRLIIKEPYVPSENFHSYFPLL